MKDDAPAPKQIPKKRRQLESAPDHWLPQWLARDDLTPSERRKIEELRQARRKPDVPVYVGVTATREGLAPQQRAGLRSALEELAPTELHHGDCYGGDEQVHMICLDLGIPVVLHPPEKAAQRAYCRGAIREEAPADYLTRDRHIVQAVGLLLAAPKELREPKATRAGGTWYTIRYARKRGTKVRRFMPDGKEEEG